MIGFGYWGPKLARNFSEIASARLCWVADLDPGRLERVREQYPAVRTTDNPEEVLDADVDAVVLATPVRTHHRLARKALLAGKHVMVEKPLTASAAEAEDLVALAESRGLTLMVGHTFIYNPAVRKLRELIAGGELGEIYYVDSARLNLGLFRTDVNVLWDLAPHDVSILLYVIGADPVTVSARGAAHITPGIHDVAYLEAQFPGDQLAHVHVSWLDPCKVRRVTVVGSRKMLVYDDLLDGERIRIYDKGVDRPYETDRFSDFHLAYRYGDVTIPHIPFEEPLRRQCTHFLDCIRDGSRPETDGLSALRVVRILEQADRSLHDGGGRLPLDGIGPALRAGPPPMIARRETTVPPRFVEVLDGS
jgi:predicted dehydrogenase